MRTIGVIGCGNMGSAIASRLKEHYSLYVYDKDQVKLQNFSGTEKSQSCVDLINQVEVVILAIKPQDFAIVLNEIKASVNGKLIISIAAGKTTAEIEGILGKARVIRVMPNIGAKTGNSVTVISKGVLATDADLKSAQELFDHIGRTKLIEESMMNAATAISGSGPAYICYDLEKNNIELSKEQEEDFFRRLTEAAQGVGFNKVDAEFLAVETVASTASVLKASKIKPADLRVQITSKGGTTEAALKELSEGKSWKEAAQAALKRAEEL